MVLIRRRKCYLGLPISFTVYSLIDNGDSIILLIERGIFKQNKTPVSVYKLDDVSVRRGILDFFLCVGYVVSTRPYLRIGKIHSCKKFASLLEEASKKYRKEIGMTYSQTIIT